MLETHEKYNAAIITVSDKGYAGTREDTSGPALAEMLKENQWNVVYQTIIPDEQDQIENVLKECADQKEIALILTTGGTGFAKRDVTPEATKRIIEKEVLGLAELMRLESLKITPYAALSRATAGIRNRSLIVNLPGSKKASTENLTAILKPLHHAVDTLLAKESLNCGEENKRVVPSMDQWKREAENDENFKKCGMYLFHNGVVRETARKQVREQIREKNVTGMNFSYNPILVQKAIEQTKQLDGIYYVRVWLNEGSLSVGDDIMLVLVGGDIRNHVMDGLTFLVSELKTKCVIEQELY